MNPTMRVRPLLSTSHYFAATLSSWHVEPTNAPSTPATMSKQHSTLLAQTATMSNDSIVKFRPFDQFDQVLPFCVQFVSTLSKGRNFVRHCCRNRQHCCQKNGNSVEATVDIVERIVQIVAFNNVASTLLLVWTGLNSRSMVVL